MTCTPSTASLRWFYAGALALLADDQTPNFWVCCRRCGALYPDPSDFRDCHKCPAEPRA